MGEGGWQDLSKNLAEPLGALGEVLPGLEAWGEGKRGRGGGLHWEGAWGVPSRPPLSALPRQECIDSSLLPARTPSPLAGCAAQGTASPSLGPVRHLDGPTFPPRAVKRPAEGDGGDNPVLACPSTAAAWERG